jgi:hypothetical protein
MPCQNGGTCQSIGINFNCSCTNGYFGTNCQFKILNSAIFNGSTILTSEQSVKLANLTDFSLNSSWSLIYQASRDGFSSSIFHSKCDGNTGTLVVIKSSNSNIFGGYTQADWSGYTWQYDSNAFLFSLVNSYKTPVKMIVTNPQYAIFAYPSYGPTFGNAHDLYISSDGLSCNSNLGYSYQVPSFLTSGTAAAQSFLAGSYNFRAIEIEVYIKIN